MPITVEADPDIDHLVIATFRGRWTWEEYDDALDELVVHIQHWHGHFYQIVDMSDVVHIPHGWAQPHLERGHPYKEQLSLMVGDESYLRLWFQLIHLDYDKHKQNIMPDLQTARERVRQHIHIANESD